MGNVSTQMQMFLEWGIGLENKVSFDVQMKTGYLFDFLFQHSYHGLYGVFNFGLSLLAVVLLVRGSGKGNIAATVALVVLALLFTVINPLLLYQKAARQMKRTLAFQKPLTYELDEEGLACTQEGERAVSEWGSIVLIRETRTNLILYFGAANAVVLPKAEFLPQVPEVKKMLHEKCPDLAKKLK